jgi:hypothetical protein
MSQSLPQIAKQHGSFSGPGCGFHVNEQIEGVELLEHTSQKIATWRDIHKTLIAKWPSHITENFQTQVRPRRDLAIEIREYYIPNLSEWKNHDLYQAEFKKLLRICGWTEQSNHCNCASSAQLRYQASA